jgi:hypothetical protein
MIYKENQGEERGGKESEGRHDPGK